MEGRLRDAVVVVVGRRRVGEHRDEAGFRGAAGAGGGRSGGRHLDVSRHRHAAALLVVEPAPGGVQVLVKLVAVHLAQELGLAQLVQCLQVTLRLWWGGQLAQVAVVEPVVYLGER